MTMTFKEALIAYLQGEKVEQRQRTRDSWMPFMHQAQNYRVCEILSSGFCDSMEFRIKPNTILVNGVEVPAGEKETPNKGTTYYIPDHSNQYLVYDFTWDGCEMDTRLLKHGLVYLDRDSAIARAKAMLIAQEVK